MKTTLKLAIFFMVCFSILLACRTLTIDAPTQPAPVATAPAPTRAIPQPTWTDEPDTPTPVANQPTPTNAPVIFTLPPTLIQETPTETLLPVSYGAIARQHLAELAERIGSRVAGSPEEASAAAYIVAAFNAYGYEAALQPFSFYNEDDEELESANVIAVKPGISSREIIVGAHYDSTIDAAGADDNASGVAVLLETAAHLQSVQAPYTIRFIAFGAEEVDLDGSRFYVRQMGRAAVRNTVGMINLDSLIAGDFAYIYGDLEVGSLANAFVVRAAKLGFELKALPAEDLDDEDGSPCECADYGPFQEAGIPFAYFEATNWNLGEQDGMTQVDESLGDKGEIRHTEYDRIDYIDDTFPGRIDRYFEMFTTLLYDTLTQFR